MANNKKSNTIWWVIGLGAAVLLVGGGIAAASKGQEEGTEEEEKTGAEEATAEEKAKPATTQPTTITVQKPATKKQPAQPVTITVQSTTPAGKKVVEAAVKAVEEKTESDNNFNWIEAIFGNAGYSFSNKTIKIIWKGSQYPRGQAEKFIPAERLRLFLLPGDWLYVNDGNESDKRGNHSVIFEGWAEETGEAAIVIDNPGGLAEEGEKPVGRIETRNLSEQGVAHVMRALDKEESSGMGRFVPDFLPVPPPGHIQQALSGLRFYRR